MSRALYLFFALGCSAPVSALSPSFQEAWTQEQLDRTGALVSEEIERIRGQEFLRPVAMRIGDKATLVAYLKKRIGETSTPAQLEGNEVMSKMLGLVPADMDLMKKAVEMLEGQVAGFYAPEEDTFYIMDRFVGPAANVIIAHEFTHALDDQLYDIDDDMRARLDDSDAGMAYHAVVEGSGMLAMNAYALAMVRSGHLDPSALQDLGGLGMEGMEDAPAILWLPMVASYLRGATFLKRTQNLVEGMLGDASAADLRRAFVDPPRSTEQILHPEKYWDEEKRDEPRRIRFHSAELPSGWERLHEDTLGELHLSLLATQPERRQTFDPDDPAIALALRYTNPLVEGWGGDRLILLGKDEARILQLVTLWDSERDAAEFYGGMLLLLPDLEDDLQRLAEISSLSNPEASLEYGAARDEVVLTLSMGARSSRLRGALEALTHAEVER